MEIAKKINYIISTLTAILSTIFGQFWFLFVFLIFLNLIDCVTGILKARYLCIVSSAKGLKGIVKKFLIWCLVAMGFGLSITFQHIGNALGINLSITQCIGWFILMHCIINEIRSILENMVQMDKDNLVPRWFTKGLKVAQDRIDQKANDFVEKIENKEERKIDNENK